MGGKDQSYQVIYRDEQLERYVPGQWAFFQRGREYGGGFWCGRVWDNAFIFELECPVSLSQCIEYMLAANKVALTAHIFEDLDGQMNLL